MQKPKLLKMKHRLALIEYPDNVVLRVDAKTLPGNASTQIKVRRVIPADTFQWLYRTVVQGNWENVFYEIVQHLLQEYGHYSNLTNLVYLYGGSIPKVKVAPLRPPAHILN